MTSIIMQLGSCVFLVLFIFLMFNFFTFILSLFINKKYPGYEPKVSIIVPCYNEEKNIERCLDAIFHLDYPKNKMEVIAIDDGSTDNTFRILKSLKKKYSNLRIFRYKRRKSEIGKWHKSYVINFGIKKSRYDIIHVIDADTFVDKTALKRIVAPLQNKEVGATHGVCLVKNKNGFLNVFQNIEYYQHNLLKRSFSNLFGNVVWFYGAFSCYKKNVIKKIGYFKGKRGEDMNTLTSIYKAGYKIKYVDDAFAYTIVPNTLKKFFSQRTRWWMSASDALKRNKCLFSIRSNISILFLFFNHYWWTLYSLLLFPLLAYQFAYWLPYNSQNFFSLSMYSFRWFSLLGPIYVIYKIPVWGVSFYNIFGVASGIIGLFFTICAIYFFKGKLNFKTASAIFFYFPYTILLNCIIIWSVIKTIFSKKKHFIH